MKDIAKKKILVIDDDEWICDILRINLENNGFEVSTASNGKTGLKEAEIFHPNLVILDIMMPEMDGYEFLDKFRSVQSFTTIPVIVLSAKGSSQDVLKSFEFGADNYIFKPFSPSVLVSHVHNTFKIVQKYGSLNALTHLPGNKMISEYVNRLLSEKKEFAFCYIDLDNFKAYNDYYGFEKGDNILLFTVESMKKVFTGKEDFIGNIGGDDFVTVVPVKGFEKKLKKLIEYFDINVKKFYKTEERTKGYIETYDRTGKIQKFPFVSLSIGAITSTEKNFHSILELSDFAVDAKKKAKFVKGSNYYISSFEDKKKDFSEKTSKLTVLMNEVRPFKLRMIKHFIEPLGFRIIKAATDRIIKKYIDSEPDILFFELPQDDLFNIVNEIRSYEKNMKSKKSYVIAVVDDITQDKLIEYIKNGIDNIITSPIDKNILYYKINRGVD